MLLILGGIALELAGLIIHKKNSAKRLSQIEYTLEDSEKQRYTIVQQSLAHLSECQRLWRIESQVGVIDWKRNAGAATTVRRSAVSIIDSLPARVTFNIRALAIESGSWKLYFLPDMILRVSNGLYAGIAYSDVLVEQGTSQFIEDELVPSDAIIVGQTWRFVNKGGGPDLRFSNNRQMPIVRYGDLKLSTVGGMQIILQTSNPDKSLAFAQCWSEYMRRSAESPGRREQWQSSRPKQGVAPTLRGRTQALKVLGLADPVSSAEVKLAYQNLAQKYHPDKVASLAPEFGALAEEKMKEINAAYKVLSEGE